MKARAAAGETLATMVAVLLAVVCALLLDPAPGAAVLGGMLALTLSRSQLERDWRGRLEAAVALPVIGVVAALVGFLLLEAPVAGAAVYTLGLTASVFVRRFGLVWRRVGGLLALPFTALLVAPPTIATAGPLARVGWLVPILVPLIAFAWVTLVQLGAKAARLPLSVPERTEGEAKGSNGSRRAASSRGPAARSATGQRDRHGWLPSDKMAVQLALALALAFIAGFLLLPRHWEWVVLTVVVVLFGNRGRVDALIKAIGRLVGALAGSVVAVGLSWLVVAALLELRGFAAMSAADWTLVVAAILVIVALGVFGRRYAYVWWVLCFTVALALIQVFTDEDVALTGAFLGERLLAILIGAVIAAGVSWLVLPVARRQPLPRTRAEWMRAFRAD